MDSEKEKRGKYVASDSDDSSDSLEIECDVCDMDFTSVKSYEQHLKSKKHYKMLGKKETKEKYKKLNKLKDDVNDDQDSEFSCDVCEKVFSDFSQYKAHMKGRGHSKNLKKLKLKEKLKEVEGIVDKFVENEEDDNDELLEKPFAHCTACQKSFSGPENYHQHLRSSAHDKKSKQQALLEKWKKDSPDVKSEDNEEEEYFCEVCGKFFSGPIPYATHMESAIHKKEVKKAKVAEDLKEFYIREEEDGKFVCKECKRSFNDPIALKIHLRRNDHEKQKSKFDIMALLSAHPEIIPIKSSEYSDEDGETSANSKEVYDFLICNICHLSFNGVPSAQNHVKSKKHLKVKQQRKEIKALKRKLKKEMNSNIENGMEFLDSHNADNSEMVSGACNDIADNALGRLKEE
ncbi:zinc finger protein 569-like [Stegodyphus dumicola]|uniref:zinc finger protein 569-like n=1 Tax=Stegodyphus dumicola TaxID=202533 RepID=UPI0015AD8B14|nr:zinc finger protein 569-like [Stegodyphus dumicola]XP_035221839.1 zinc finger protein 569-like [Stegodyphus dumicola]